MPSGSSGDITYLRELIELSGLVYDEIPYGEATKVGDTAQYYCSGCPRREGVGRRLVDACEAWFQAEGCGAVHIEVFGPNSDATAFYSQLGYQVRDLHQLKLLR